MGLPILSVLGALRLSHCVPFIRLIRSCFGAALGFKTRENEKVYGFTDLRGNREEGGCGDADPRIKTHVTRWPGGGRGAICELRLAGYMCALINIMRPCTSHHMSPMRIHPIHNIASTKTALRDATSLHTRDHTPVRHASNARHTQGGLARKRRPTQTPLLDRPRSCQRASPAWAALRARSPSRSARRCGVTAALGSKPARCLPGSRWPQRPLRPRRGSLVSPLCRP